MSTPEQGGGYTAEIAEMYDQQAATYDAFKGPSFSWQYIEQPAFHRMLYGDGTPEFPDLETGIPDVPNLYTPDTRALDVGCGSGVLTRHLLSQGLNPANITGIDISANLLNIARAACPGVTFTEASADAFDLPPGSVDLAVSNMTFHYLDNDQWRRSLELIRRALRPGGTLCFVDAHPESNEQSRDPATINTWLELPTPWGGTARWFNRDPYAMLLDDLYYAGFDVVGFNVSADGSLPISPEGATADPAAYARYSSFPARIGVRLERVDDAETARRACALGTPDLRLGHAALILPNGERDKHD